MQPVIIIGGGLGGLFTGALLAKEGFKVTILEKNRTLGGGLQTFRRGQTVFETGMHVLGGLREGGSIYKICAYLGILDRMQLRDVDADCIDSVTYLADRKTYRLPCGREAFADYLATEFPAEAAAVHAYIDRLYALSEEVNLFYLRRGRDELFQHSDDFLWSADQLIAHYIQDPRLRDLLGYMNPMYGGVAGHTPAYIHALINVLYINGPSRFVGGSQQMADALADVISSHGGRILTQHAVAGIEITDRQIRTLTLQTPQGDATWSVEDTLVVSDIHPQALLSMCNDGAFPKSYRERVASIPNSYSCFTLYIVFKSGAFPYINHTCYLQDDYGLVWSHGDYQADLWPQGFMFMTPAEAQTDYATKMIVNCIMPFSVVKPWEQTRTGHRGADYEAWKQRHVERVLDKLSQLFPDFRSAIDRVYAASPLTIRDFYGEPEGALYGVRKDCQNIMLSQIPVQTKARNLLLTGQNINLHGICGVPLTAINTVEAIIGQNRMVDKINDFMGDNGS